MVDMDQVVAGTVDETTGAVTFAESDTPENYGVVDEIARRVLLAGGTVLSVRQADIPEAASLAAVFRYEF
jgi:hypothetical protein